MLPYWGWRGTARKASSIFSSFSRRRESQVCSSKDRQGKKGILGRQRNNCQVTEDKTSKPVRQMISNSVSSEYKVQGEYIWECERTHTFRYMHLDEKLSKKTMSIIQCLIGTFKFYFKNYLTFYKIK